MDETITTATFADDTAMLTVSDSQLVVTELNWSLLSIALLNEHINLEHKQKSQHVTYCHIAIRRIVYTLTTRLFRMQDLR